MTVKELKLIISTLPEDTPVKINSVWDSEMNELVATECSGVYHESRKELYLTPEIISIENTTIRDFDDLVESIEDIVDEAVENENVYKEIQKASIKRKISEILNNYAYDNELY